MKKMVIALTAVVVILIVVITMLIYDLYLRKSYYDQTHPGYDFNCIETEELAKSVTDLICKSVFPGVEYEQYSLKVYYETYTDEWVVYYCPIDDEGNFLDVLDGGGPAVCIKKKTGEITYIALKK